MNVTGSRTPTGAPEPAPGLRRGLLGVLAFGTAGVAVELALIGHYEDTWQLLPLVLLGLALAAMLAAAVRPGPPTVRALRVVAVVCALSGVVGQVLHYRGNAEFELEVFPDLSGWALFADSMRGATPVLAPGTMTVIGLLGLLWAWRHPALRERRGERSATRPARAPDGP